ncbi:hypothetical protein Tco_1290844 [Tanacetum coccineum]
MFGQKAMLRFGQKAMLRFGQKVVVEIWSKGNVEIWSKGNVEIWSKGNVEIWSKGSDDEIDDGYSDSYYQESVCDYSSGEAVSKDDFSGIKEHGDDEEREGLCNNIVSTVKQSVAINRPGVANMKPRELSDAIHEEDG